MWSAKRRAVTVLPSSSAPKKNSTPSTGSSLRRKVMHKIGVVSRSESGVRREKGQFSTRDLRTATLMVSEPDQGIAKEAVVLIGFSERTHKNMDRGAID